MTADSEHPQYAILFIDDEQQSQKYFAQIFGKLFTIHLASSGEEGLELFRKHKGQIGVVVSDQRMPGMAGSEVLATIAEEDPDVVNILSTAYSDLDAAIDAVNEGGLYRYVTKPWDLAELEVTLRRAMDFYQLKEQHRLLARVKIAGLEQMFHQSRLMACLAIPSLIEEDATSIRAFRDLLRLSLDIDEFDANAQLTQMRALSQSARNELREKSKNGLESLMRMIKANEAPSPDSLSSLNELLLKDTHGLPHSKLVQAFFLLLQGEADADDLKFLAQLLSAYKAGYVIEQSANGWQMVQANGADQATDTFGELYSLFVDDPYLVGFILGNLR